MDEEKIIKEYFEKQLKLHGKKAGAFIVNVNPAISALTVNIAEKKKTYIVVAE